MLRLSYRFGEGKKVSDGFLRRCSVSKTKGSHRSALFIFLLYVLCENFGTPQVLKMVTEFMPPWYTDSEVERMQWLNKVVNKVGHLYDIHYSYCTLY